MTLNDILTAPDAPDYVLAERHQEQHGERTEMMTASEYYAQDQDAESGERDEHGDVYCRYVAVDDTEDAEEDDEPIGRHRAALMHRLLARLGSRTHYATASKALGREVTSLSDLTVDEANAVLRYYADGRPYTPIN